MKRTRVVGAEEQLRLSASLPTNRRSHIGANPKVMATKATNRSCGADAETRLAGPLPCHSLRLLALHFVRVDITGLNELSSPVLAVIGPCIAAPDCGICLTGWDQQETQCRKQNRRASNDPHQSRTSFRVISCHLTHSLPLSERKRLAELETIGGLPLDLVTT